MGGVHLLDMLIIRTTEMIPLFEKRVCQPTHSSVSSTDLMESTVCVSSLLVDEIKRIIKTSEIMKYACTKNRRILTGIAWLTTT